MFRWHSGHQTETVEWTVPTLPTVIPMVMWLLGCVQSNKENNTSTLIHSHVTARFRVLDHPDNWRIPLSGNRQEKCSHPWCFSWWGAGRERKSEAFRIGFCLLVSCGFHLCEQKITAQQEEGKKNLYSWQALRQSWIIYLFCNSFLSNILFQSLAIKNWNASFSVNVLALTICLTLDKLFNLSKPVFLSISTVPDTM